MPQTLSKLFWDTTQQTLSTWQAYLSRVEGADFQSELNQLLELAAKGRLEDLTRILNKRDNRSLSKFARAMSLSLEWVNCCETAHRSLRNRKKAAINSAGVEKTTFVLTAHPTESRSPEMIMVVDRLTQTLLRALENDESPSAADLETSFALAWKIPFSKQARPTVQDEAKHIFTLLLRRPILKLLTGADLNRFVQIRTWVGGDKDGHPGVNALEMKKVLALSRKELLKAVRDEMEVFKEDLNALSSAHVFGVKTKRVDSAHRKFLGSLRNLQALRNNDGGRVRSLSKELQKLSEATSDLLKTQHPSLEMIAGLLTLFPALVVPLELREDSSEIVAALKKKKGPILGMLRMLASICRGGQALHYARGFVVSMTRDADDLVHAALLQKLAFSGQIPLPVVPLFETAKALGEASQIVQDFLSRPGILGQITKNWDRQFEVMLGYSDSAKESGALFSRRSIQRAMRGIEEIVLKSGLTPIFFHGSGGNVARGGGSLEEQTAWWPDSALRRYKATVQGEMIHRTFATPEILRSNVSKVVSQNRKEKTAQSSSLESAALDNFINRVAQIYRERISDPNFATLILSCTPYPYLDELRIGSRPNKRATTQFSIQGLRAIPWVLCWTQTRVIFPAWWGIGSAWAEADPNTRNEIQSLFKKDTFLSSFVKTLAFSLSKVRMTVWQNYLRELGGTESAERFTNEFRQEFELACAFVQDLSQERDLLWFRPWLREVIEYRNPMVDLVNAVQIEAIKRKDPLLLRETVTGIASGMLTTG